ncbi:single-stranded DNA-binding protein [Promicromonospora thailandica]|nr:single-stranded DNA-binding protein [Promicromonospora thailandica]
MKDVMVTVSGFVGNNPALHVNPAKDRQWTTFRVASTRRYVNDDGEWTDGRTLWFTVKAWQAAAANVARSVRKGDPVVVTGRLEIDEWTGPDGQERMTLEIAASAVGIDATRGKVEFSRMVHHGPLGAPDPFAVDAPAGDDEPAPDTGAAPEPEGEGQRELVNA